MAFLAAVFTLVVADGAGAKPCREHPALSAACFPVRGSMSLWNGNPTVRIRVADGGRVLGVSDQRFLLPGYVNLPADIRVRLDWSSGLVGDFVVCPFTDDEPGVMRMVCVESAANLEKRPRED